ncbi:uncharacterized protein LOC106866387 [Brachypodium distachyon]|uniref:uncharacterized protein LOC106866387 n=1 Tax=Brachypodium distachyon TaxID=15368 RepID=UPI00071CAFA7|nr:uncharacterized protein LOC106866387 [Brachypodium distachyon]|eukprot:XP_014755978.1 uncharacterized protein LOC106866387 [Brachypodium distachyon]
MAPDAGAAPSTVPATTRAAASPRAPTAPPARGIFRGFTLRRKPPKADSLASAGKRERDNSPPAAPSKKACTDTSSGADRADTGAYGAATASAGVLAPMEMALATGPSTPAPGAGATVVNFDFDVKVTATTEEPEAVPTPSPVMPAAAAAATTAATGTASGDTPVAADAAGADSSATQQGAELYRRLEAQRAELQGALDLLAAAQAETKKEHAEVLAAAQARIDEKGGLIPNYLGEIQGLCVKLEVQIKATASAVDASVRHEIQLHAAKDKAARLETELATVQEELAKAGEPNATQAVQLALLASRLHKAKKAVEVDGTDVSTLIPFFSDLVGNFTVLDVWIAKFGTDEVANCAREMAANGEFHQAGQGDFPFEAQLRDVTTYLRMPSPEFRAYRYADRPGHVDISAKIRGRQVYPVTRDVTFTVEADTWEAGLIKAMQEALARICGDAQQYDDLERYLDSVQSQHEVTRIISDAHLHARDELNRELALADVQIAALKRENDLLKTKDMESQQKGQELEALNKDAKDELQQLQETAVIQQEELGEAVDEKEELKNQINSFEMEVHLLKGTISTLREELEEARDNGEDVQAKDEAFLSNDEDYEEEMQFTVEVQKLLLGILLASRKLLLTVPAAGAGAMVVDLGSDAEDAGTRKEPEGAPAPSSPAADTVVAAPAALAGGADPTATP